MTAYTTMAAELSRGRTVTSFTVGVSMRPLLTERKTHVTIAPITAGVQPGDIALYTRPNGALVLHRCIRVEEERCYMRGDNTYGLEPVARSQVLGVVTHIYRKGKRFDTKNRAYRAYVQFWNVSYPVRWLFWRGKQAARGMLRRMYK